MSSPRPEPRTASQTQPRTPSKQEPAGAAKRRPDLRIVPRSRRRRAGMLAALACVLLFGIALGLAAFQTKIAADQLRLDRIERQTTQAQARYERLRLAVAQFESPAVVVGAAKAKGMQTPAQVTYVSPSAADVEAVAATAAPASGAAAGTTADSVTGWSSMKPLVSDAP
jgi:Tfp pilus assembly protein PilV